MTWKGFYIKRLEITDHALTRFIERYAEKEGNKKWKVKDIKNIVGEKLVTKMRGGVEVSKTGAIYLEVLDDIWAVVKADNNGYVVITFLTSKELRKSV